MTRKEGRVFNRVEELLREAGRLDLRGLEVATLSRGPDHLVVLKGETIGEYNHVSDRLYLYDLTSE
jgi:hypothetical protein